MIDDPNAPTEVCVEIRDERRASYGVLGFEDAFRLLGTPRELIWLPKSAISLIHRQPGGASVVEIPRWLAEKEGLIAVAEKPDPNQGVLL